jgi:hypothetical protein
MIEDPQELDEAGNPISPAPKPRKTLKPGQKSVRVVMPLSLYNELKEFAIDHGDISRLVRHLLRGWIIEAKKKGEEMPPISRLSD